MSCCVISTPPEVDNTNLQGNKYIFVKSKQISHVSALRELTKELHLLPTQYCLLTDIDAHKNIQL